MDRPGSGIRRLAGLFLALNLGVAVVGLGFVYWPVKPPEMPEFNGDKVTFLATPNGVDANESHKNESVEAPDAAPASSVQTEANPRATLCLAWKSLDANKVLAVESHLKQLGISPGSYELRLSQRLGWWVYLSPFRDPEALRLAMEDARRKGVTDLAQVRGGKLANAISLGAFPSLAKAREHASSLAEKGLSGIQSGPRPEAGEVRLLLTRDAAGKSADGLDKDWPKDLTPEGCVPN